MTPNLVPLILKYWHKKDDDNHSDLDDKDKDDKGDYFRISRKKTLRITCPFSEWSVTEQTKTGSWNLRGDDITSALKREMKEWNLVTS